MAVVLHPLEQRLDRLGAEVEALLGRGERVGLVDEEHAVEGAAHGPLGLDRGQADVLADETGAVDLDQVAATKEPHRVVHLGEEARDRRLAGARVAEEDEVLRGRDLREPVLRAPALHLEERDERADLLLHGLEADEGVELGLELLHAARRRGLAQEVELVGDPVGAAVASADPQAVGQHAQAVLEVVERLPRHTTCNLPRRRAQAALSPAAGSASWASSARFSSSIADSTELLRRPSRRATWSSACIVTGAARSTVRRPLAVDRIR